MGLKVKVQDERTDEINSIAIYSILIQLHQSTFKIHIFFLNRLRSNQLNNCQSKIPETSVWGKLKSPQA